MRLRRAAMSVGPLLLALSCSSGGDGGSADEPSVEDVATQDGTTTTVAADQPSAAQLDEVIPYIEDLLARYDEAVNEIVADPSVAADRRDPTVEAFLALFEAGSEFADGSLEGWAAQAEQDVALQPTSPDRDVNTTNLEGPPTSVDDDTVLFGHCTVQSYVVVEDGEETRRVERKLLPGNGVAVRVDGRWLLQEITTPPDTQGCLTRGGVPGEEPG